MRVVEVLDPMVLNSKIQEHSCHGEVAQIPAAISELFEEELVCGSVDRYLLVTLGQFSPRSCDACQPNPCDA